MQRIPGPVRTTGVALVLDLSHVIGHRIADPCELIAGQFLDVCERVIDVAAKSSTLRQARLLCDQIQSLPEAVEMVAGQRERERIGNKGLTAHAASLGERLLGRKGLRVVASRLGLHAAVKDNLYTLVLSTIRSSLYGLVVGSHDHVSLGWWISAAQPRLDPKGSGGDAIAAPPPPSVRNGSPHQRPRLGEGLSRFPTSIRCPVCQPSERPARSAASLPPEIFAASSGEISVIPDA
jgi:hypothetical protein